MKKLIAAICAIAMMLMSPVDVFAVRQVINGADQNYGDTGNPAVDGARFRTDNTLTTTGDGDDFGNGTPSILVDAPGDIGTLTCVGDTTITGRTGSATASLKRLNADGGPGKTVALDGNAFISTLNFGGDGKVALGAGKDFTGKITTTDDTGTLTFKGSSNFTGDIGAAGAALSKINSNGSGKTVAFSGDVYSTELNFGGDNTATMADGKTLTGKVTTDTDDTGTLTMNGTSGVTGQVGTNVKKLKEVQGGSAGSTATFFSDVYSTLVTVLNTGIAVFRGDLTGTTLNYAADGTATFADGKNLKSNVTTAGAGTGTLTFLGDSTVKGKIGTVASPLKQINADGAGKTVAFKDSVRATALNFGGDSTITLANNKTLAADVTTSALNTGTVTFLGDATMNGKIGVAGTEIKRINIDGVGGGFTVDFKDGVHAQSFNFGDDNTVTITNNSNLDTTVTTSTDNTGTVTFLGDSNVTGNVGEAGAVVKQINVNGAGNTVAFKGDVSATTVDIAGAGGIVKVADGKDLNATVTNTGGAGILTFNGATTVGGAIGTAIQPLTEVNFNGATNLGQDIASADTTIKTGSTVKVINDITITGDLTVTNTASSVLDIGVHALTLAGTGRYIQRANSKLIVGVSGLTAGSITGSGNANVNAASVLDVIVDSYVPSGTTFKIIDGAGGVNVNVPGTINSSSPMYTFAGTSAAGDLSVTATRSNTFDSVATGNAAAAGAVLENIAKAGATGDMLTVINALNSLPTTDDVAQALATLVPVVDAGVINLSASVLNNFVGVAMDRVRQVLTSPSAVDSATTGVSTGEEGVLKGLWAKGYGSYQTQGARKNVRGYDAWNLGTALGIDRLFGDSLTLGISGGYAYGNVDSDANNATTDINSAQTTIYGGYQDANYPFFIDAAGSFAYNWYDGERDINIGGVILRKAKADYGGQQYGAYLGGGYIIDVTKNIEFTPLISLQWAHLRLNRYNETEAGSLNLSLASQSYDLLQSGLGARIASPMKQKWGTLTPEIHGKWFYDFIGDPFAGTSSFSGGGGAFTSNGAKPARNSFNVGGQLACAFKNDFSVILDCDTELKDKYFGIFGSATLRYNF